MPVIFDKIPQVFLELDQEIMQYWPELVRLMNNHASDNFEVRLGEAAAFVNIYCHGNYSVQDLENLAEHILERLKKRRASVIWTPHSLH